MLRVSLLGEQIIDDRETGEVRSRSPRTLALVGYLALHAGSPQRRQLIAARFWPESTDAQALTNLRRELHQLRQLLGSDDSLSVTSTDLCWRDSDGCRVDVRVFEQLRDRARTAVLSGDWRAAARHATAGIAGYGGELLPSVYDDWVVEARTRLRRECVELCDLVVDTCTEGGDIRAGIDAARRRVALEPLEEVGYRSLMELQVRLGDRGGAVSTYHHCASVLERELGVAPDPTTRALLDQLIGRSGRAGDRGRRRGPGALRVAASGGPPLIGRRATLERLTGHWEAAAAGHGVRVVVVRGDAGVGKSRLVGELADRVRAGHGSVAESQCFDIAGRLALAPVAEWLRSEDLRAATRTIDPVWRQQVERLVPELTVTAPGEPPAGGRSMVDAWQRHRFFEGLAHAFLVVRRPLLLVLDNLQWCDQETLDWLTVVLTLGARRPLMVATTLREEPDEPNHVVASWLARLRTGPTVADVPLAALDARETALLYAAVTGSRVPEDKAAVLHAATGGFPLFVIEAARAADDADAVVRPTEGLATVLRRRVEQTSPAARAVAGLAAALGRDFTLDLITDASDLDAEEVARAVDELWRRRIVREMGSGYDFSHDLLRDTAYAMVSPPRRWLLHRRLADALERSALTGDDSLAALLAEQYDRGGRPDLALSHYRRAADVAASRYAFAEAIRLHRRALRLVEGQQPGPHRDRCELDCLLATAAPLNALRGYASLEQQAVLERAVTLAEGIGSPRLLVASMLSLWSSRFVQGRIADSHRLISRALTVSEVDDVLLGEAHFAFAGSTVTMGRPAEALQHFGQAHDRCLGAESLAVGSRPDAHALAWAAHAHWLLGEPETAARRARDAVARARGYAHPYSLAIALAYAAVTYQLLDDRDAMAGTVEELVSTCRRYEFAYYGEWGLVLGGWLRGGDEGLADLGSGIANLRGQLSLARLPYWLTLKADVLVRGGREEAAAAVLDAARAAAVARGDLWWLPEVLRLRSRLCPPSSPARRRLLAAALETATQQGSLALAERCRSDLAAGRP